MASKIKQISDKLTLKIVSETNILESVKNCDFGIINLDRFDEVNKFVNYFLFARKEIYVLNNIG